MTGSQGQDTSEALAAAIKSAFWPSGGCVTQSDMERQLLAEAVLAAGYVAPADHQRALAAERERVLLEAADDRESPHFPCCEHCGVKQRGYGHTTPCTDCQTAAAAIARGNPHTEESP